jgi:endo-1,4-beta-xylanase
MLLTNEPNAWEWQWGVADGIMDWAEENELTVTGHTLLWHEGSLAWLTNVPGTLDPLPRAQAMENLERYISTVATRYSGRIYSWDVINEVVDIPWNADISTWRRNPDWRNYVRRTGENRGLHWGDNTEVFSRWYDAFANGARGNECGTDFIYYAFRFARMYDPFAILYYNDYETYNPVKREVIAQMVEQINERWLSDPLYDDRLLIEGIGMQGHYPLNGPNIENLRATLRRFAETGAVLSITEMDIHAFDEQNRPTSATQLSQAYNAQASAYGRVFQTLLEFSDIIERVTFWGKADHISWRHTDAHLFDAEFNAKPAFFALIQEAANAAPANISVPLITTESLPSGETGEYYAVQLSATQNNNAPIRWRVTSGELPHGLRLIATTGVIIGTPTYSNSSYTFTVAAENALGSGEKTFTIDVGPMVPLRLIAETLGAEVIWLAETRTVEILRDSIMFSLTIDTPLPNDMGTPVIVGSSTFVPLRYIAETLGAEISWNAEEQVVIIEL